MEASQNISEKKPWFRKKRWWFFLIIVIALTSVGLYLYNSFNRLLSDALLQSFNKNIVSDVYELKFDKLAVNFLDGDIKVSDVVMQPREKPLQDYPYINSSFQLTTHKLVLKNVKIMELLRNQILDLDKIEIVNPEVTLNLEGPIIVMFPFKDSTSVAVKTNKKKAVDSFHLQKFELVNANFNVTNSFKERQFTIQNLNFAFYDLYISQYYGQDSLSCKSLELSIEKVVGSLLKSPVREVSFRNFKFALDNVKFEKSLDTIVYHFNDLTTTFDSLEVQTADSILHLAVRNFNTAYKYKSILLQGINFTPNISEAAMQKRYNYQNTQFSANIGSIELRNINFDTLIYYRKIFIDELIADSVSAAFFKDKTKPADPKRFPKYPNEQIKQINFPFQINKVTVSNGSITNRERKPDGSYAKVIINRMKAKASNITNLDTTGILNATVEGALMGKVLFSVNLKFDYARPQFYIQGNVGKFNLPDLNQLLLAYTPATINKGTGDKLSFTGTVFRDHASGEMTFLYHDLDMNLKIKDKAKWISDLGAFAANNVLPSANPISADKPARTVKYSAERDMHKGFINIIIKSVISGLKETIIPSKENRKAQSVKKKDLKLKQKGNKNP